jgi:simple sugar transport system ATP-binding protein/ribose transport system ATP-binding protein
VSSAPDTALASDPHIELVGIGKRFGGVQALTDVSVTFERGQIHALVGENGAGKSTLGKIIAGVHRPDVGEMYVDGRHVDYRSPRDALNDGLTIIAQEPTLVPHRSVIDNVFLGIEPRRHGLINRRAMTRQYEDLVARAQLELPPNAYPRSLRVADQQKAEILRALARDVRLVVMDEPTSALTTDEVERLFEIARALRENGTTIIYVSHFLDEVLGLAETITVLRDGRHVRTAPASAETPQTLVQAMLGRSLELVFPAKSDLPADAPVVLSVRGLERGAAVRDVSFDVRAGEIVGLAGLIGSGRSEVARGIFGADRLDAGLIELDGKGVRIRSPRQAVRRRIAMLPEDRKTHGLLMLRSIVENITLPHLDQLTTAFTINRRKERRRARDLIERVDVRSKTGAARVSTLSGGNQQKVLFAKWLFRQPRVFIADEPTRGVDVGAKHAIYELIHSLAEDGMAIVLISSEHEELLGLAHRVLVMRAGKIVAEFDRHSMTEDAVLHAAFATEATASVKEMR